MEVLVGYGSNITMLPPNAGGFGSRFRSKNKSKSLTGGEPDAASTEKVDVSLATSRRAV